MLRLTGGPVESLFDELLPVEVRELPADLAALDRLPFDRLLLAPIEGVWEQSARRHGRPTIPDGQLRTADGGQAAHRLGLRDPGAGGIRLAAPAAVLPDRLDRAGAE